MLCRELIAICFAPPYEICSKKSHFSSRGRNYSCCETLGITPTRPHDLVGLTAGQFVECTRIERKSSKQRLTEEGESNWANHRAGELYQTWTTNVTPAYRVQGLVIICSLLVTKLANPPKICSIDIRPEK
jgi:hypothetical protein